MCAAGSASPQQERPWAALGWSSLGGKGFISGASYSSERHSLEKGKPEAEAGRERFL